MNIKCMLEAVYKSERNSNKLWQLLFSKYGCSSLSFTFFCMEIKKTKTNEGNGV